MDDAQTRFEEGTPSLLERVAAIKGGWIEAGRVVVDGQVATDPDRPTPRGQRLYLSGG